MKSIYPPLQQTIQDAILIEGIGLHRGQIARMFLRPAPSNTGIMFYRTDLKQPQTLRASLENVKQTMLATTLGEAPEQIDTVEHLLSALMALSVDNLIIEIEGPEVPILDGSAGPIVKKIRDVGRVFQPSEKIVYRPTQKLRVEDGDKWIEITPANHYQITFTIDFPHPHIGEQTYIYQHSPEQYEIDIAHARTFGMVQDVEWLRKNGFGLGGGLENAVVIGQDGVLNPEGLRYPDELVRHKILDLIGDFAMIGGSLLGTVHAYKSGHTLNRLLVEKMLQPNMLEAMPVLALDESSLLT